MKILIVGDTVPNTDFDFELKVQQFINQHDVKICNLEGALSQQQQKIHKAGPCVLLNDIHFQKLAQYFNVVTLANNHTMDYQEEGLFYTISQCENKEVLYCGAGKNINEAIKPIRIDNISIVSVAENEFGSAQKNKAGIATVEYGKEIFKTIQKEKEHGQIVIIIVHGGSEIIPIPPPYFRNQLQMYKEYGADLVIGNHPHVPQGKEENIYYSLGNFIFLSADFSQYFNHDWSIMVSYDSETNKCVEHFCKIKDQIMTFVDKKEEFEILCNVLKSEEYESLYTKISNTLYPLWYGELQTQAHAYLLHHIRCNAHKNIVQRALAYKIGEYTINNKRYDISLQNGDGIKLNELSF